MKGRDSIFSLRHSLWEIAENLTPTRYRPSLIYLRAQRKLPNYRQPRAFNEKVLWRMRFDRRPLIGHTCDKLWVKDHGDRCGVSSARTLWFGSDFTKVPVLEGDWVTKPNHQSGKVMFGSGQPNKQELALRWSEWLEPYARGIELGQWAYSQARPLILFERRLGPIGTDLPDYKIYVFNGQVAMIQVVETKFTDHKRTVYTPDWTQIEHEHAGKHIPSRGEACPPPDELDALLDAASRLGADFDFIRVDLYVVDGVVYLGELTPYPDGGFRRFGSRALDEYLGELWALPTL